MTAQHGRPAAPSSSPAAPPSTDLVPVDTSSQANALVPTSIDGAFQLARWLSSAQLLPPALRGKEADLFTMILSGMELGLPPMAALRGMYIVNGKPALEAKTKAAICLQRGAAVYFRRTEYTPEATTWETLRRGETEPRLSRYTKAEAKAAGLLDKEGPWRGYWQRMISHRALGWLCDDAYPDVVLGVATAEDFEDDQIQFRPIAPVAPGVDIGTVRAPAAAPAAREPGPPPAHHTKPAAAPAAKPPLTEADVEEIITAIGKCETRATLRELATQRINGAVMDEATRKTLLEAYEGQLAEIEIAAKEQAAKSGAAK